MGGANGHGVSQDVTHTLDHSGEAVTTRSGIRRLTPLECERLQAFPDRWTALGHDGRELADGSRYRMCGNAVTVNVVEWIGRRIVAACPAAVVPS